MTTSFDCNLQSTSKLYSEVFKINNNKPSIDKNSEQGANNKCNIILQNIGNLDLR